MRTADAPHPDRDMPSPLTAQRNGLPGGERLQDDIVRDESITWEGRGIQVQKFRCEICEYVYDPETGDPDGDVAGGTAFPELPEEWKCPMCAAGVEAFVPREEAGETGGAVRTYHRPGLRVLWRSGLCNHNGNCSRSLPAVFDPARRPWVDVEAADIEDICRVIDACPTGALTYEREDGDSSTG